MGNLFAYFGQKEGLSSCSILVLRISDSSPSDGNGALQNEEA